jgi:DNA-binding CsgD family transcriptional regulator
MSAMKGKTGSPARGDLLKIVEAAYRMDGADDDWLQSLAETALPSFNRGFGVTAVEFHAAAGTSDLVSHPGSAGMNERMRKVVELGWKKCPPEGRPRALPGGGMCVTASEALGEAFTTSPYVREDLQPLGVFDILWIGMPDPAGNCCALGIGLSEVTRISASARKQFRLIAAHLTTSLRLRRRLRTIEADGDAVIRADGLVDRVRGEAVTPSARTALRAAAVALDTARGALRGLDADRALELWQSLVTARWSLVDEFDRRGRRYFIAHENDPPLANCSQLTRREQLVIEYAALGHTNKFIAYELGLSASAVATYLKRGMTKLRINTRVGLIKRFRRSG